MTESDVIGWVFDINDGTRWAVQADTKEAALDIFTKTPPPTLRWSTSTRSREPTPASTSWRPAKPFCRPGTVEGGPVETNGSRACSQRLHARPQTKSGWD